MPATASTNAAAAAASAQQQKETAEREVLSAMQGAASLLVPLEVNFAWGDSWASAKS